MSWRDESACKGLPQIYFYPPLFKRDRSAAEHTYYGMGKMACHWCPVRRECAEEGKDEEFGLWGGKTPKERWGRDIKQPSKVLPRERLHLLASMGEDPDLVAMRERIAPFLEKR